MNNTVSCQKSHAQHNSNLVELLYFITSDLNRGLSVDNINTYFSKAFERISHKLILYKHKACSFVDNITFWIDYFLCERK